MSNNTRSAAMELSEQLHICMVKAIDIALTDRVGTDWFEKFRTYDSNQDIPILDKSQTSVQRMDLQACLKFFRYRSDYSKIVFEYYGHNFYVDTDDAKKAQILLNQRLDNLIHNARNYLFAHAGASMVEGGKDDSIRYSMYGVDEAIRDILKLAGFFDKVTDDEGNSYYQQMKKMSEPSKSYSINEAITVEGLDLPVGTFAEICNKLSIKVATAKDGDMTFLSGNYDGDIAKIKLYVNQNIKKVSKYNIAETIQKEAVKSDIGAFVVACQNLNIPVSTDDGGELAFSSSNYTGDVARIKLELGNNKTKKSRKLLVLIIIVLVLLAGVVALILGLSADRANDNKPDTQTTSAQITDAPIATTVPATETTSTTPAVVLADDDWKTAVVELGNNIRNACASESYDDFASCYIDCDEDTLRKEYSTWSNICSNYDQFIATPVAEVESDVYVANFLYAIVTGTYPNTNSNVGGINYVVVNTPSGIKISNNEDLLAKANDYWLGVAPEGYIKSTRDGNNAAAFNGYNWASVDSNLCIVGPVDTWPKFLWQDANGDVYLNMLINNGTDINRTVYNYDITIVDKTIGKICEVKIDENCSVKKLSNKSFTVKIPADEILTGTQTWTQMSCDIGTDHK